MKLVVFSNKIKHSRSLEAFIIDRRGKMIATSAAESISVPTNKGKTRLKAINSREPIIKATAKQTLQQFEDFQQIKQKTFFTFDFNHKRQLVQIVPLKIVTISTG